MTEMLHVTNARWKLLNAVNAGEVHRDDWGDYWLGHRRVDSRVRELQYAGLVTLPGGPDDAVRPWRLTDRGRAVLRNGDRYTPRRTW